MLFRSFQVQLQGQAENDTPWLLAIQFFLLFLAYRYVGNDYTSGTNNVPAVDINYSKFLPSLLQEKSLLAFVIKPKPSSNNTPVLLG